MRALVLQRSHRRVLRGRSRRLLHARSPVPRFICTLDRALDRPCRGVLHRRDANHRRRSLSDRRPRRRSRRDLDGPAHPRSAPMAGRGHCFRSERRLARRVLDVESRTAYGWSRALSGTPRAQERTRGRLRTSRTRIPTPQARSTRPAASRRTSPRAPSAWLRVAIPGRAVRANCKRFGLSIRPEP